MIDASLAVSNDEPMISAVRCDVKNGYDRVEPASLGGEAGIPCRRVKLLIDGKWMAAKSGSTFVVVDPSSGGPVARIAEAEAADVDAAVAARRAFAGGPWARMAASECGHLL